MLCVLLPYRLGRQIFDLPAVGEHPSVKGRADRYLYAGGEMAAVIPSRLYLLPEAIYDIVHEAIFTFQLHGAVRTVVHREDTAAVLAYVIALRPWAEDAL